jgi:hypothetical protein
MERIRFLVPLAAAVALSACEARVQWAVDGVGRFCVPESQFVRMVPRGIRVPNGASDALGFDECNDVNGAPPVNCPFPFAVTGGAVSALGKSSLYRLHDLERVSSDGSESERQPLIVTTEASGAFRIPAVESDAEIRVARGEEPISEQKGVGSATWAAICHIDYGVGDSDGALPGRRFFCRRVVSTQAYSVAYAFRARTDVLIDVAALDRAIVSVVEGWRCE